ncbi:MAG: restriction endonuclease [Haliscomenobacteraceae bacterium CHB4]|nr:restriction endonuclease [Haliscomenobacteraceae bacterium CHB4]
MDTLDKKSLLEKQIEDEYIVPALKGSGWHDWQIARQESYTAGRIIVRRGSANLWTRGERKIPDFVLYHVAHLPLAVIEAKDNNHTVEHGLGQALEYADADAGGLDVLFVYSTNGDGFIELDKTTGEEKFLTLDQFPLPADLWRRYLAAKGLSAEHGSLIETPYYDGATPYYFQYIAVNRIFETVLRGERRMMLVMATGTGKTFMASQIIYRLREARLARRFLFLVDRNTLADQTMRDDFKIFSPVMTKITNRKVEKEYQVYLSLYQAVTGTEEEKNVYKEFSPDFFDVVIVDECHRGSADDDAAWREVIEYFEPAVQIGLTATPKETRQTSNTEYFQNVLYTYSLFRGIDDGFLAPFKVIEKIVDKDRAGYVPEEGKADKLTGELLPARVYNTLDFDRNLVIEERTQLVAKHVSDFLKSTDRKQKTIIFCRDIDHAERMKIALIAENLDLYEDNPKYIMQITSGEKGDAGRAELENFQSKEPKYPIIVTTSKLLTTGVNAPTVKLIVLDAFIQSRTEFKQIIGRGTRIAEKFGKVFFTIMDFRGSTQQFYDPDFDGNPLPLDDFDETEPVLPAKERDQPKPDDDTGGQRKYVVDGVPVDVVMETVRYYDGAGRIMHENLTDYTRRNILENFASIEDFLTRWNEADRKEALLAELRTHGILTDALKDETGERFKQLDDFDLICHLAFGAKPLTRAERADDVQKRDIYARYGGQARQVLDALLQKYADEGIASIEDTQDLKVRPFTDIGTPVEIVKMFGGKDAYFAMLAELKNELYKISA